MSANLFQRGCKAIVFNEPTTKKTPYLDTLAPSQSKQARHSQSYKKWAFNYDDLLLKDYKRVKICFKNSGSWGVCKVWKEPEFA